MDFRIMRKNLSKSRGNIIAVLDVGTTKTCCAVARVEDEQTLRVIGVGHQVSKGMRAGSIIDIEAVETSILNAVHNAEQAASETIRHILVNVAGGRPISQMVDVEAVITGRAVDHNDVKSILNQGQFAYQSADQEVIHTIPLSYTIDQSHGIRDPRGMFGDKLIAKMHVVQTPLSPLRNLATCINRCHLDISSFVISPYASGLGALVEDEMDLGVTLLDLGGGTTTIAIFMGGNLVFADAIPVGGEHITSDIARGLSTPLAHAERLKTLYGSAVMSPADDREMILVPQVGESDYADSVQVTKSTLTRIIQPRLEETLELVRHRLNQSGMIPRVGRRLVLTGGASQMFGVRELAAQVLDKQVRLAKPLPVQGLSDAVSGPAFATCVGLLRYAQKIPEPEKSYASVLGGTEDLWGKLADWFRERF